MSLDPNSEFMLRAVELARRGAGFVEPNPMVGCVIVHQGMIIGEGHHQKFGLPHAEVNAIRSADIENDDRNVVFHAHRKGRYVHNLEPSLNGINVGEVVEARRVRVLTGVGVIDAVDTALRHKEGLAIRFDGSQGARRVGRHERVAGPGGEDNNATLFQVTHGAPPDVRFRDLLDRNRRLYTHDGARLLQCILEREGIHDCAEHAGIIRRGPIHAGFRDGRSAPEVAAADGHGDFHALGARSRDLVRDVAQGYGIDSKDARAHQRFTAELDQRPPVLTLHKRLRGP